MGSPVVRAACWLDQGDLKIGYAFEWTKTARATDEVWRALGQTLEKLAPNIPANS